MKKQLLLLGMACMLAFSCQNDDDSSQVSTALTADSDGDGVVDAKDECPEKAGSNNGCPVGPEAIELANHSQTPAYFKKSAGFENVEIYSLLSSGDQLEETPNFVYGSMADGAGLIKEDDGTYTLINNIEADYSIARVKFDETFKPVHGEYILNAMATGFTAQCSGSLITPEEHGFGPLYMSGGEWGGASKGVFITDPYRSASSADVPFMSTNMGEWSTENAVALNKNAFPGKTVVVIGDDQADNTTPSGHLGLYIGNHGDLIGGDLFTLKVDNDAITYEMDMEEGTTYDAEFIKMNERSILELDAEAKSKGAMGFSRVEDIDWRRGSAENNKEFYFCVTGRKKSGLVGKGTLYGRVYKVVMEEISENSNGDITGAKAKITCVLDGDKMNGKAWGFHSPDNIVVTENYAYIQEDPNGYNDDPVRDHYAKLYQYNLNTGDLKSVLECDQDEALKAGVGRAGKNWEITGMIDVSDIIGIDESFLMITQNHGWEPADGSAFTDPQANPLGNSRKEGSQLFLVKGLAR